MNDDITLIIECVLRFVLSTKRCFHLHTIVEFIDIYRHSYHCQFLRIYQYVFVIGNLWQYKALYRKLFFLKIIYMQSIRRYILFFFYLYSYKKFLPSHLYNSFLLNTPHIKFAKTNGTVKNPKEKKIISHRSNYLKRLFQLLLFSSPLGSFRVCVTITRLGEQSVNPLLSLLTQPRTVKIHLLACLFLSGKVRI